MTAEDGELSGQTERVLDALTEALTGREGTRRVIERALPDQSIFDGYQTACLLADEVWPLLQAARHDVAQAQRDADVKRLPNHPGAAYTLRIAPLITEEATRGD